MANILIVDDRAINRDFLTMLLGYAGHRVEEAGDGVAALDAARRSPPDLIITDVLMPCMDGVEFAHRLKADPALAAIPVIFYTATFRLDAARSLAASCGVTLVLPKPSEPQAILDTVARTLGSGKADVPRRDEASPPCRTPYPAWSPMHRHDAQALGMRLATLLELGLALASERDTLRLLKVACRGSQELMHVRYAAIGMVDEQGRLQHLETAGLPASAQAALGSAAATPDFLAAYHPPASSFLSEEIASIHRRHGWLYLAGRLEEGPFTAEDEQMAATLAAKIALAWENLSLYEQTLHAKEALQQARDELEMRVEERTRELADANLSLRFEMAVRERTEAELRRSNAELEQFAYIAAHDLQEPLRTIISFLQLLAKRYRGRLDAEADQFIDFAVHGADRMYALICGVLAYSKVRTAGRQSALATDSNAALDGALANLQAAVTEAGAEISRDPLPRVVADACQLTQLFQNLLANALKFRTPAAPRIHVSAQPDGTDWRFSVRDNGIGIAPRHHQRIFGIFQRLHGRGEYGGTGIGLALCQKIVDNHGGRIWVESAPGQGSTFCFTLPGAAAPG